MSQQHVCSSYIEYGSPEFRAVLYALFLAGFAIFSSLYCVQPMMPLLADFFIVSATQSSFPLSFSTVALAIGLLLSGLLSDRFGRKPLMLSGLFAAAFLLMLSAILPYWTFFLASRVFIGLAVSGVAAVAMTYIGEEIAEKDVGLAMGLYISGTAIGAMSGRLIAGVLVDFISWQSTTLLIAVINLGIAISFYYLLPNSKHFTPYPMQWQRFSRSIQNSFADQKLRLLFLQGFILMGCFVSVFNYMSYHLLQAPFYLSQVWIGVLSLTYLAGIYSSPRAAQWGNQFGRDRVLPMMLLLMLVGVSLMLSESLWILLLGLLLFSFAFFAAHSITSSWVAVQALQYRAVGSSLYLFSYYMGSSILGSSSGMLWETAGWLGLIVGVSSLLILGVAIAWQLKAPQ